MHHKAKKSLGQNFLIDANVQRKILDACTFTAEDRVLEIGAGKGELTALIACKAAKLIALEVDRALIPVLTNNLKAYTNIKILHQDILKFDLAKLQETKIKVFGNIPYYITTPIIEHLLKFSDKIEVVFLTVQKEFAQRMAAQPGSKEYGAFSCFAQYYTEPKIIFTIKKNSFRPVPKVDSAFLCLKIRELPPVEVKDEVMFFKIIRRAFQQRRKTLKNSLAGVVAPQTLREFFVRYKINPKIRPEDLSLQDFAHLANLV